MNPPPPPQKSPSRGNTHEQAFNYALAKALCRCRADWNNRNTQAEQTGLLADPHHRLRPDILVHPDQLNPVIIESAFTDTQNTDHDAINRLGLRLGKHTILTAIALRIPAHVRTLSPVDEQLDDYLAKTEDLDYAVYSIHSPTPPPQPQPPYDYRFPPTPSTYLRGSAGDIADAIELAATPAAYIDKLVSQAVQEVRANAQELNRQLTSAVQQQIAREIGQPDPQHAMDVACCIWLNAMVLQGRLANAKITDRHGVPFNSPWENPEPTAEQSLSTWQNILNINYHSVFRPALLSLKRLDDKAPRLANMVAEGLAAQAKTLCTLRLTTAGDVAADMYPLLAADRKDTAAFYTLPKIAEFLATLAFQRIPPTPNHDHKIVDFACGTGTLLKSAYRATRRNAQKQDGGKTDMARLHKNHMENLIYGADIQPIATHLTAAGLAGMSPESPFADSRIICASVKEGNIGALNLLNDDTPGLIDIMAYSHEYTGVDGDKARFNVADGAMDVCVLNPPYTGARGGHRLFNMTGITPAERDHAIANLGKAIKKSPFASSQAGLGALFTGLADRKLKEGGTLAMVLPLTAASQNSWKQWRHHLLKKYRDLIAIAAPESFSADTGMREMLLCGKKKRTRRRKGQDEHKNDGIAIVNLRANPLNMLEAHEYARALANIADTPEGELRIGNASPFATWTKITPENGDPWGGLGGNTSELPKHAEAIHRGTLVNPEDDSEHPINPPPAPLDQHCPIGPTHHLIGHLANHAPIGAFTFHPYQADRHATHRALWRANHVTQRCLQCQPTHYGKIHHQPTAAKIAQQKSRLFIARNLGFPSQALAAAITPTPCHGGTAWAALLCEEKALNAYCLWLNSIFGLIARWYDGGKQHVGRSRMQIRDLENLKTPTFAAPTPAATHARQAADRAMQSLLTRPLLPCAYAWRDSTRKAIDQAVTDMLQLSLSDDHRQELRILFSTDPSVHANKRDITTKLRQDGLIP